MTMPRPDRVRVGGPPLSFAEGFGMRLVEQGYTPCSVQFQLQLLAHLSRWMEAGGVEVGDGGTVPDASRARPRQQRPDPQRQADPANKDCAAGAAQIALVEIWRFADPQPGAPQQNNQSTKSLSVGAIANSTHHRDDLVDGRRVGRVVLALVPRRASAVIARHRRRRAAMTGDIQRHRFHDLLLGGSA
jgi:hypothetical protein